MAPREKVATDQKTYHVNLMDSYLETKKNGGFAKFWAMAYQEWFKLWLEQEDTSIKDESEQKEALTQAIKKRQQKPKPIQVATPKVQKAKRGLQLLKAYSNQYYNTQVTTNVPAILEKGHVPQGKHLAVIHKQVEVAFNKEIPEFQEDFAAIHAKILKDHAIARKKVMKEANLITLMSYKVGIESIEAHFKAFASGTDVSGWSFILLAGGPDPRNRGRINTMSLYKIPNDMLLTLMQLLASEDCKEHRLGSLPAASPLPGSGVGYIKLSTSYYMGACGLDNAVTSYSTPFFSHWFNLPPEISRDSIPTCLHSFIFPHTHSTSGPPTNPPPTIKPMMLKRAIKKATKKATSKLTTDITQTESPILSIQPTVAAACADTLFSGLPPIINPMPVVPAAPVNTIFSDPINFDPDVDTSMWDGFNVEVALNAMNSKAADFNPPAMYPSLTQELVVPLPNFFLNGNHPLANTLYVFPPEYPLSIAPHLSTINATLLTPQVHEPPPANVPVPTAPNDLPVPAVPNDSPPNVPPVPTTPNNQPVDAAEDSVSTHKRKRSRNDRTDPKLIMTTKCARKCQQSTKVEAITNKIQKKRELKEKENQHIMPTVL
ncbi:hypothetical protein BDN71DRAFT_1436767 [Pleurotus eryngii]|uniref:Uncharacterized protein n=1 Tax=Pleurotus eryngii TaxID=5323 RepID=A0A9P5ZI93_PLEER|nr:hypothetical protein BDN71DRAFT_1436767 [Pleurotus eryngii]